MSRPTQEESHRECVTDRLYAIEDLLEKILDAVRKMAGKKEIEE
jgi:hypothetical protein